MISFIPKDDFDEWSHSCTATFVNHAFMYFTLCTGALSCLGKFEPLGTMGTRQKYTMSGTPFYHRVQGTYSDLGLIMHVSGRWKLQKSEKIPQGEHAQKLHKNNNPNSELIMEPLFFQDSAVWTRVHFPSRPKAISNKVILGNCVLSSLRQHNVEDLYMRILVRCPNYVANERK